MGVEYHARVFRNGRSRAVRIPSGIDLPGDELVFRQEGKVVTITPVAKKPNLLEVLAAMTPAQEKFPEIDDPAPEPVEI
jgi:antitoxin VapB